MDQPKKRTATVLFGVCAFVCAALLYTIGYFQLGETWGTHNFRELERASTPGFKIVVHDSGPPYLRRSYPNVFLAAVFQPPARLESWLTGVDVEVWDRSKIDHNFIVEDNSHLTASPR
jgi:hypothetical protein